MLLSILWHKEMSKSFFVSAELERTSGQQEIHLDISAVPILKQETHLPVFVDVTHSTGRRDLLLPCAKAAIAIGADGVMAEVHPVFLAVALLRCPSSKWTLDQFDNFYNEFTCIKLCQDLIINGNLH